MYKNTVISNYPQAICRKIDAPNGAYYLIFDMESLAPNLIGMSLKTEEDAWEHASSIISTSMLKKLEK